MSNESQQLRLDEILIREGLVSEEQVREALLRQKAHGGKFGSQLLYHRYIDEAGLVKALSIQFGCEGVVLSNLEIPDILTKMIPKKVALARKVIPFDYDTENDILKVACENPNDQNMINELKFVTRGKTVNLYVAAEIALNTSIARHYLKQDVTLEDSLLLEIPDTATATEKIRIINGETDQTSQLRTTNMLIVTDETYSSQLLQSILERDNIKAEILDSLETAYSRLNTGCITTILIRDGMITDHAHLRDYVRHISPSTTVRIFKSVSSLVLANSLVKESHQQLQENLELFTSLLASLAHLESNHSAQVGQYAEKLCRKLNLPASDRMLIITAGYVHDLSRYYYGTDETTDTRGRIHLTIKLLSSLGYSQPVISILKKMYSDLTHDQQDTLSLEVLGGNILTIADLFCDNMPHNDRLSLDKFDAIKKKLHDLTGKLFLADVVDAFVELVQKEILDLRTRGVAGQIMIYGKSAALTHPLEMRLTNVGFRIITHTSKASLLELYKRSQPDIMILSLVEGFDQVEAFIGEIENEGINFEETPTFLLVENTEISKLTRQLERGIEDIMAHDDNLDILVTKIRKLQNRLNAASGRTDGSSGARGRLADMNLIDLLQALGPGRKTVRITVTPNTEKAPSLILYLCAGAISFAELEHRSGPEAVYEGLTWTDGTWTIEPVNPEDLPEPNNQLPNESILMEGCRLLDERVKSGQLL